MAKKPVYIGILGCGTVGSAVVHLLKKNAAIIEKKVGASIRVKKVADLKKKNLGVPFTRDPFEVINDPAISIVVEAIGGESPAKKYILAALRRKKFLVTSNKEVIAKNLKLILDTAHQNRVAVLFEAAVGGGIPIIRPLRESLSGNNITEVYGIVNGTTNYILTSMTDKKTDFAQALKEAKDKGYAERDPRADIEGYDASYKAAILASVAFNADIKWKQVEFEGISKITKEDIRIAKSIGYVIKLLVIAKQNEGKVEISVHPTLVPQYHPLASVAGPYNAIYVVGNAVKDLMFYGQGAGGDPTASAIVGDIIDIVRHGSTLYDSLTLYRGQLRPAGEIKSRYYLRLTVPDRYGVLAKISKALGDQKVSIQAVLQEETKGSVASLVIILHTVAAKNLSKALSKIKKLSVVKKIDNVIRII